MEVLGAACGFDGRDVSETDQRCRDYLVTGTEEQIENALLTIEHGIGPIDSSGRGHTLMDRAENGGPTVRGAGVLAGDRRRREHLQLQCQKAQQDQ